MKTLIRELSLEAFKVVIDSFFRLYPSICLEMDYPKGEGFFIFGEEQCKQVLSVKEENYWYQKQPQDEPQIVMGCALAVCYLPPNNNLKGVPYLPIKHLNRVYMGECMQCIREGHTDLCCHPKSQRRFIDSYTFIELGYATKLGYEIRVIQAYCFLEHEKLFQQYFKLLTSYKLKYEKPPADQNISEYCKTVNDLMAFSGNPDLELTPTNIQPNSSMR